MQRSGRRISPIVVALAAVALGLVFATVSSAPPARTPPEGPGPSESTISGTAGVPTTTTGATLLPTATILPTPTSAVFVAPSINWPLPDLDPGLASRGPRPTLDHLATFLSGNNPIVSVSTTSRAAGWQLTNPNMQAVSGYADAVSVLPGESIGLHLAGSDRRARIDVYRLGARDAEHVLGVADIPVAPLRIPTPDPATGLDAMGWPLAYRVAVPATWRSGVYLAKVSAAHGQSYVPFIVRPPRPGGLVVMLPTLTYQAYNSWNEVSLYHRPRAGPGSPGRGYKVSFDRPYAWEGGAGLLFRTAFPLIVWLEDHGYEPGFIADTDLAAEPAYATEARTFVIAGHAEYWTASMRDALLVAEARQVGIVAFGANLAYRQVRLEPGTDGTAGRTVVCSKDASLDPLTRTDPQLATIEFAKLPQPRPAREVFGADWAGIAGKPQPLVVARGIETFDPGIGLRAGEALPMLLGGELDQLADPTDGMALTETPIVNTAGEPIRPTASLWVSPNGAHVFDAGTFAWTWGLDPRYAAALPDFPGDAFAHLTADILAWAGTAPGG
ncbi:MAG: hypothetical protein HY264_01450 [Chloroflexi bacterium]|nr:hypothetical protein [Chloroflexota bacterium]